MTETLDMNQSGGSGQRPTFLTVLCILSFISAGFAIIGLILLGLAGGMMQSAANGLAAAAESAEATAAVNGAMGNIWLFVGIATVLTLVSLFGVIQMWKLKKSGFYLYTGASLVGVILPLVMGQDLSMFSMVLTAAFIVMYGLNLKAMN